MSFTLVGRVRRCCVRTIASPPSRRPIWSLLRGAVILVGFSMVQQQAVAQLAQVLLMCHGHKDFAPHHDNLSLAGFQCAVGSASVMSACFGRPTQITAFALDPDTRNNAHSYQTAVPLAVASGVNTLIDPPSSPDSRLYSDPFFVLVDFEAYLQTQQRNDGRWLDQRVWCCSSLMNTARSGLFSSDRSTQDYANRISNVDPIPLELAFSLSEKAAHQPST